MERMLAYPPMMRLAALAFVAAALCAAAADSAQDGWKTFEVRLAAGSMHEECATVEAGEQRRYQWKTDGPVDFNIHYHQEQEVLYPVKREGMRGDGGAFTAKTREDYCWMWTARDKPLKLEGRIEAR